jgi:hypothetical protein
LGAFCVFLPEAKKRKTGLSAPIQRILVCKIRKDFRFYPLRGPASAALRAAEAESESSSKNAREFFPVNGR